MDYTVMDIKRQINSMIYLNIMSYSVLSGCGNCSKPDMKDIAQLESILDQLPIAERPCSIFFTKSLYKKSIPQYDIGGEDPYDFNNFKWINKKSKKHIDLKVMANSIISCCNLIERFLTYDLQVENTDFIMFLLYKTALYQAKFIQHHLKVGNLFYHGEDLTGEEGQELQIQIAPDNPDRISQFAVFHAFSALHQVCSYNIFTHDSFEDGIFEDINLLPGLTANLMENLEDCSTRELSQIGLHLIEIYKRVDVCSDNNYKALVEISRVISSRTMPGGDISRKRTNEEICSINTASNCLNLLSQLIYMFGNKECNGACQSIYDKIDSIWDEQHGIFKLKSSNKQSYNVREASSLLAALFSLLRIVEDPYLKEHIQRQVKAFSEVVFIKSGLYNGQCIPILQQNKMELQADLKSTKPWAPVFNKLFEYKISKKKFYCDADIFRADYVLPACSILLSSINN